MGNNPINMIDPTGGIAWDCIVEAILKALTQASKFVATNANSITSLISIAAQGSVASLVGGIEPPNPSKSNGIGNQRLCKTTQKNNPQKSINVDNLINQEIQNTKSSIDAKVKELVTINRSLVRTRIFAKGMQNNIDDGTMSDDPGSGSKLVYEVYRQYFSNEVKILSKDSIFIRGEIIDLMKKLRFLQSLGQQPPAQTPNIELPSKF
jgi:hypothetical protein